VSAEQRSDSGSRVLIRRFDVADIEDFLRYQGSAAVRRYQRGAAMTAAAAAAFVELQARQPDTARGAWHASAIELVPNGPVIGDLGIWIPEDPAAAVGDVGFQLDPAYHGRGLAREALQAFLPSAFETFALDRITASCDARNAASWRLLERLGFQLTGRTDDERHYEITRLRWSSSTETETAPS
jgi:ribosomal-protein-alanine N-acetyltransferase